MCRLGITLLVRLHLKMFTVCLMYSVFAGRSVTMDLAWVCQLAKQLHGRRTHWQFAARPQPKREGQDFCKHAAFPNSQHAVLHAIRECHTACLALQYMFRSSCPYCRYGQTLQTNQINSVLSSNSGFFISSFRCFSGSYVFKQGSNAATMAVFQHA